MNDITPNLISIIVRTKNEEKWLPFCLESVFGQKTQLNIEVILVDNGSSDHTVSIAKRFPVAKIINIDTFLPGKAINDGIRSSKGEYIVCLSAHCVPKENNWLETLLKNFETSNIAGVYGRQLPLQHTSSVDKRDLLMVFGLDRKVQKKDYFFHNANSMIPRFIWEKFPFDENVTNIEDRIWGKEVIKAGYNIIYDPDAEVYHHHGLHQNNNAKRSESVVSVLEKVESKTLNQMPLQMSPEQVKVAAIIPVMGDLEKKTKFWQLFEKLVSFLKMSKYINEIFCLSENRYLSENFDIKWLERKKIKNSNSLSLKELLKEALKLIEEEQFFPTSVLYANYEYEKRPKDLFDILIKDSLLNDFDMMFPGLVDYGQYWYLDKDDNYRQTDSSFSSREFRSPNYKALYGLGWIIRSHNLRKEDIFDCRTGILKLKNHKYALRTRK